MQALSTSGCTNKSQQQDPVGLLTDTGAHTPRVSSEGSNLRRIGCLDPAPDLQEIQRIQEHVELHPQSKISKIQAMEKYRATGPGSSTHKL